MKVIHSILLVSFVVLAISCKKPLDDEVFAPLLKGDNKMIPYKLKDLVRYTDVQGNPATLTVSKDSTWWSYSSEDVRCQYRSLFLTSEQGKFGIILSVYGIGNLNPSGWVSKEEMRHLDIKLLPDSQIVSVFYDFKGNLIMFPEKRMYLYDSAIIDDHVYYEIAFRDDETTQLYYNKTYGVLQIRQNGANIFTLNP